MSVSRATGSGSMLLMPKSTICIVPSEWLVVFGPVEVGVEEGGSSSDSLTEGGSMGGTGLAVDGV